MQWFQKGRFVCFILQVCAVFSAEGYSVNKVTGERFAGPVTMVVTIVGQQQCVKECLARPKLCKGVNYLKKHLLCEVVSSTEESEPSSDYTRISIDHQMNEINNCHVCTTNQKCVQLSSNSSYCVKEDSDMNDCGAYHNSTPFLPSGLYRIKLPVVGHVTALCEMDIDGGGWTVFQRRLNGTEDFYRTWVEYKNGFGNLTAEFWFGNEKLYHLLSQGSYELRMDMSDFTNQTRYVKYSNVGLTDEITKYTISLSNYSGNVEDCFTRASGINNMKFTTRDQDNDPYLTANCANLYPSGWWHNQCHCANPNGLYLDGQTNQFGKGITYNPWLTQYYSLKTISLMVRRV
uniref:Fibrinogen C-terminal domain-containing protein n=2 Tax=Magallana gigas TaxID=29159 RepID=A0A8W8MA27_MAGGI